MNDVPAVPDPASLHDSTVIVTGASRGIGSAIARHLAARGARVVCTARTLRSGDHVLDGSLEETVAAITAAGGTAYPLVARLEDEEECARLVAEARAVYGPIDGLVNNAAVAFFSPVREFRPSRAVLSWRVTCHAPFLLAQQVLDEMVARGRGRIVNITSESAVGPGTAPYAGGGPVGDALYGAQKAFVERFTQGLAEEVQPLGVGVAALAPSLVVPTPGALRNEHITGEDDPRAEPARYMAEAVAELLTAPLDTMAGRIVYSQQLLRERGLIDDGAGRGVDPALAVSGFSLR